MFSLAPQRREASCPRGSFRRSPFRRGVVASLAFVMSSCVFFAVCGFAIPWARAELPVQDNELVLGMGGGVALLPEEEQGGERYLTIGYQLELYAGLLERATSWLDVEMVLGLCALGSRSGIAQTLHGQQQRSQFLPGAFLRGGLRALWDQGGGPTLGLGAEAQVLAAPAVGSVMRVLLQAGLGWELWRVARSRVGLELVYGYAIVDDLAERDFSVHPAVQGVSLRLNYSF